MSNYTYFSWVGSQQNYVDEISIQQLSHVILGRYGGNSCAGQYKNEDGCVIWCNEKEDWEFVALLDAHNTSESAELVVKVLESEKENLEDILRLELNQNMLHRLEEKLLKMFQSNEVLTACKNVTGETACLIVVRKDNYLWWFSVGDGLLYLFHPELASLGQYQVNQRQFFEWIGQVNTFAQEVPCYTVGTKELRQGMNRIFLTTDGLVECPNEPYADPWNIYASFEEVSDEVAIKRMFINIKKNNVRDSTTIISWQIDCLKKATMPSDNNKRPKPLI